jgi:hypothetical protein
MPIKPIKAQDITDEIANRFTEVMRCHYGSYSLDTKPNTIRDIANALIEAGIVSPPVWAVRNLKTGRLASHPITRLRDLIPDKKEPLVDGWEYEHWKGQTE